MNIRCEALDCVYNSAEDCLANVIHVGAARRETYCDTYTRRTAPDDMAGKLAHIPDSRADAEFGSELTDTPNISCTATRCAYNRAFRCRAGGVRISQPHERMCSCLTFRPK